MNARGTGIRNRIRVLFSKDEGRSAQARRQVLLASLAKIITIICSLLIVPLTKDYLNPTRYGIWLTLSSIIAWISYFDFGLSNGFRNRFAEAKAKGDTQLAKEYVSTTYFALTILVLLIWTAVMIINQFIDWSSTLRVDSSLQFELKTVFTILCSLFCLNMIVSVFTTMLTADQRNGVAAWVNAIGQVISLGVILILTTVSEGSLVKLALYYSSIPTLFILVVSVFSFSGKKYSLFRPRFYNIKTSLIRDILSLGVNFFFISICLLVIFQMMNIVISREFGPEAVTEYNIAYKYFNVLYAALLIVITPFWSAFTDAYTKKDYRWMSDVSHKLELICLLFSLLGLLMLAIAPFVYHLWVGDDVPIATMTSIAALLYIIAQMIGNVYMYMINGIGTIRIQLCIYIAMALIAWPLMIWSSRHFGLAGIVLAPSLACLVQAVSGRIQFHKIINGTACGWWLK